MFVCISLCLCLHAHTCAHKHTYVVTYIIICCLILFYRAGDTVYSIYLFYFQSIHEIGYKYFHKPEFITVAMQGPFNLAHSWILSCENSQSCLVMVLEELTLFWAWLRKNEVWPPLSYSGGIKMSHVSNIFFLAVQDKVPQIRFVTE